MPVFILKHSRTIQRSDIRPRVCDVSPGTAQPPTSSIGIERDYRLERTVIEPTAMTTSKPNLFNVSMILNIPGVKLQSSVITEVIAAATIQTLHTNRLFPTHLVELGVQTCPTIM